MAVCYLEIDDEITGAIGRIRAVTDDEVIVVVPPGSRIATSRINFKLLGKEANERRLNIVAVSDEPQVRALAISAGHTDLRLARRRRAGAGQIPRRGPPAGRARRAVARRAARASVAAGPLLLPRALVAGSGDVPTETMVLPSPLREVPSAEGRARPAQPDSAETRCSRDYRAAAPAAAAVTTGLRRSDSPIGATPAARRQRKQSRVSIAPLLVIGLLLLLVAGVGYGAYTFLPTATITITPSTTELRPSPFAVTADPNVAVIDVPAGVVPAELVELPLHVAGTFPATGVETRETRAAGQVRFRSENTLDQVAVPDGTVVATADGIQFLTTQAATIPRADFATSTPGTVDVPVRAVDAGPRGNVARGIDHSSAPADRRPARQRPQPQADRWRPADRGSVGYARRLRRGGRVADRTARRRAGGRPGRSGQRAARPDHVPVHCHVRRGTARSAGQRPGRHGGADLQPRPGRAEGR